MVPPKNLGVLGMLKTLSQPTNRKFQTGSARGGGGGSGAMEKPKRKTQLQVEEEERAAELMAQHREARGPSLATLHAGKSKQQVPCCVRIG